MNKLIALLFLVFLINPAQSRDVGELRSECVQWERLESGHSLSDRQVASAMYCVGYIRAMADFSSMFCLVSTSPELKVKVFDSDFIKEQMLGLFGSKAENYQSSQLVKMFINWANKNPEKWQDEVSTNVSQFMPGCM